MANRRGPMAVGRFVLASFLEIASGQIACLFCFAWLGSARLGRAWLWLWQDTTSGSTYLQWSFGARGSTRRSLVAVCRADSRPSPTSVSTCLSLPCHNHYTPVKICHTAVILAPEQSGVIRIALLLRPGGCMIVRPFDVATPKVPRHPWYSTDSCFVFSCALVANRTAREARMQ